MAPERLTPLDASFLFLERPNVHMHIAVLSVFEPPARTNARGWSQEVRRTIEARLPLIPRFRKKVLEVPAGLGLPVWVDDPAFDLDAHVHRAALPAPGGRRELMELAQDVLSRPLYRRRPLWDLTVIEGLEDGYVATLMKVHHALMDGISGMQIASAIYDPDPSPTVSSDRPAWRPEPPPATLGLATDALRDLVVGSLFAGSAAMRALRRAPGATAVELGELASGVRRILELGARPRTPFDVAIGPDRRFSTTEIPFERFREITSALGGTVNDVVLTVVGAALGSYLGGARPKTSDRDVRVLVPVSVRGDGDAFGNRVVPAFVDVPVDAMSIVRRLELVRSRTRFLKASSMVRSADAIIALGAFAPSSVLSVLARSVSSAPWFNVVVSNTPGPRQPLFLAGARLVGSYPSMPLGPTSALSIACTSLGGTMAFGLTADRDALPDLDRLTLALDDAVAEASKAAGL
jgi:WS/DGAT/MGAT family acyltransferase